MSLLDSALEFTRTYQQEILLALFISVIIEGIYYLRLAVKRLPNAGDIESTFLRRLALCVYLPMGLVFMPVNIVYAFIKYRKDGFRQNVKDLVENLKYGFTELIPEVWSSSYKPK